MVKILELDNILGKRVRNRIYRVGIELEGGWKQLKTGMKLVRDGSVLFQTPPPQHPGNRLDAMPAIIRGRPVPRNEREQAGLLEQLNTQLNTANLRRPPILTIPVTPPAPRDAPELAVGEYPSEPLEVTKFPTWMQAYYPSHVNATCGLHVHMSFKSAKDYQRLMIPEYQASIIAYVGLWAKGERLEKSHPIWDRLSGNSGYCVHEFWPDEQAMKVDKDHDRRRYGHRYTAINYPHLRNGTIECRLLPMMEKADQAVRAVQTVLNITNACLVATYKDRHLGKETSSIVAEDIYIDRRQVFV